MKKRYILLIILFLLACMAYTHWIISGMMPSDYLPVNVQTVGLSVYGTDRDRGNLLAVQPWMTSMVYAREHYFFAALDQCLIKAKNQGLLNEKTVVLFPEYIGTWLAVVDERRQVYEADTMTEAMKTMILSHPVRFGKAFFSAEKSTKDAVKYSIFKMKSVQMAKVYDHVFSKLAGKYRVTIVAGSIILPSPTIADGHLAAGEGKLLNVTPIYCPDGQAAALLTEKIYITADEQEFAAGTPHSGPQVYQTPIGKLGVMICADSWFPQAYRNLKDGGAQVIAVPSFASPDGVTRPWPGYSGFPNPSDVDPRDLKHLSETEAWMKYALPGRIAASGANFGMINYFRGKVWNMKTNGYVLIVERRKVTKIRNEKKNAVVNAWLP